MPLPDPEDLPEGPVIVCPHGYPTEAIPTGCEGPGWWVDMADECEECDAEPCSQPYYRTPEDNRA